MAGIIVYVLTKDGEFNKNSLGAISKAASVAGDLGGEASAVVVGEGLDAGKLAELGKYGAAKVYNVNGPEGVAAPVVDAIEKIAGENGINYALFGGGLLGFEIGAGLAARMGWGVTAEATDLKADGGKLVVSRPVLQDSNIVDVGYPGAGGVAVARTNAFEPNDSVGAAGEVVATEVQFNDFSLRAKLVERGVQEGADVNIEDADILVAGGRGLGEAANFSLADNLAGALGGAVAATRAVVDAGWFPYAGQIGQTGKTVAPKLYLALGISGAIQHKVGMQNSDTIVAINKDPNAPIFEFSDLGVVGDLHAIAPKLTEAIKAKKG
jgi:electron transfer flavoprotein alpha subunit